MWWMPVLPPVQPYIFLLDQSIFFSFTYGGVGGWGWQLVVVSDLVHGLTLPLLEMSCIVSMLPNHPSIPRNVVHDIHISQPPFNPCECPYMLSIYPNHPSILVKALHINPISQTPINPCYWHTYYPYIPTTHQSIRMFYMLSMLPNFP